jgi:hypothetical protein
MKTGFWAEGGGFERSLLLRAQLRRRRHSEQLHESPFISPVDQISMPIVALVCLSTLTLAYVRLPDFTWAPLKADEWKAGNRYELTLILAIEELSGTFCRTL